MKRELARFLSGEQSGAEFIPRFGALFAPFDGPEDEDLDEEAAAEFQMFEYIHGGKFGESEDFIPLRTDWTYGDEIGPYGWLDDDAYRLAIRRELERRGISIDRNETHEDSRD
jgi:hypothetical protein